MSKMLWEASFAIFSIHLISNWLFFFYLPCFLGEMQVIWLKRNAKIFLGRLQFHRVVNTIHHLTSKDKLQKLFWMLPRLIMLAWREVIQSTSKRYMVRVCGTPSLSCLKQLSLTLMNVSHRTLGSWEFKCSRDYCGNTRIFERCLPKNVSEFDLLWDTISPWGFDLPPSLSLSLSWVFWPVGGTRDEICEFIRL